MADDGERKASPQLVGAIVLGLAVVDFVVENRDPLEIKFLFFLSFHAHVWTALLITSVLAIVAAEFFAHVLRKRRNS